MSENTEAVKKKKSKSKKAEKILEVHIHPIVVFYSIVFTILVLYYSFILERVPIVLGLLMSFISVFLSYYNFYQRKIIITKNKFYVYRLGKKTISLSFSTDFLHIKYEKTKLGRLLNYGSILLVTQENKYYKVHFVNDVEKVFYTAIEEYENVMAIYNPDYEKKLTKEKENENGEELIDSSDNFEKIE